MAPPVFNTVPRAGWIAVSVIAAAVTLLVVLKLTLPLMPWDAPYAPARLSDQTRLGQALGFHGPVKRLVTAYFEADDNVTHTDPVTPHVRAMLDVNPDGQQATLTTITPSGTTRRTVRTQGNSVVVLDGTKVYERFTFDGPCLTRHEDLLFQLTVEQTCDDQGRPVHRRTTDRRFGRLGQWGQTIHWGPKGRTATVTPDGEPSTETRRVVNERGLVLRQVYSGGKPERIDYVFDRLGNWVSARDPRDAFGRQLPYELFGDGRLLYRRYPFMTRAIEYREVPRRGDRP
ncbi:hypothetical protein LAJ19_16365 (plasmid) [Deinococcus taeanensis]|uniref:hypothetical protein n=1 Tax=Deinococcus taeanensis TaxID=2737050 RepID=UPI001CDC9140|nr:hypothetical protein [Deinococcus taeanensis]UBV44730.1 hypothetical protein LAJ19_16365 [Deinococcus taeanensis]